MAGERRRGGTDPAKSARFALSPHRRRQPRAGLHLARADPNWGAGGHAAGVVDRRPTMLVDEILAAAILDQLLHDAEVVRINGPSWQPRGRIDILAEDCTGHPQPAEPTPRRKP